MALKVIAKVFAPSSMSQQASLTPYTQIVLWFNPERSGITEKSLMMAHF